MLIFASVLIFVYCFGCWLYLAYDLFDGKPDADETVLCVTMTLFAPLVVPLVVLVILPGFLAYWLGRFCGHLKVEFRRGAGESAL